MLAQRSWGAVKHLLGLCKQWLLRRGKVSCWWATLAFHEFCYRKLCQLCEETKRSSMSLVSGILSQGFDPRSRTALEAEVLDGAETFSGTEDTSLLQRLIFSDYWDCKLTTQHAGRQTNEQEPVASEPFVWCTHFLMQECSCSRSMLPISFGCASLLSRRFWSFAANGVAQVCLMWKLVEEKQLHMS